MSALQISSIRYEIRCRYTILICKWNQSLTFEKPQFVKQIVVMSSLVPSQINACINSTSNFDSLLVQSVGSLNANFDGKARKFRFCLHSILNNDLKFVLSVNSGKQKLQKCKTKTIGNDERFIFSQLFRIIFGNQNSRDRLC